MLSRTAKTGFVETNRRDALTLQLLATSTFLINNRKYINNSKSIVYFLLLLVTFASSCKDVQLVQRAKYCLCVYTKRNIVWGTLNIKVSAMSKVNSNQLPT